MRIPERGNFKPAHLMSLFKECFDASCRVGGFANCEYDGPKEEKVERNCGRLSFRSSGVAQAAEERMLRRGTKTAGGVCGHWPCIARFDTVPNGPQGHYF